MKTRSLLVIIILSCLMCACGKETEVTVSSVSVSSVATVEETKTSISEEPEKESSSGDRFLAIPDKNVLPAEIAAVFYDNAGFTVLDHGYSEDDTLSFAGREFTLQEYDYNTFGDPEELVSGNYDHRDIYWKGYTIIDLDGDSKEELVYYLSCNLGDDGYYLIFSVVEGSVIAYPVLFREMGTLMSDGTMDASSGASNIEIWIITGFRKDGFNRKILARMNGDNGETTCYIGDKKVTYPEYREFFRTERSTRGALWITTEEDESWLNYWYHNDLEFDENVETYYSSDGSVYIWMDYDQELSIIVDGEIEIPVKITMGGYGPYIVKSDCDGDGESEYLIAECEGTGTGCRIYGLCIVDKENDEWKLTRYDGSYFSNILANRIITEYSKESGIINIFVDGEPDEHEPFVGLSKESMKRGFDHFCWTDIVGVEFIDGKPWLSAPAGFEYSDNNVPDYDAELIATAPITINADKTIEVGNIRLAGHNYMLDYELQAFEKETEVFSCIRDVTHDGKTDLIRVTYITTDDFDGKFTENTFKNGAFGYVKVYSDMEGEYYTEEFFDMIYLPLWGVDYAYAHAGNRQVFVTTVDGKDYIVTTSLYDGQGNSYYEYEVFFVGNNCIYQVDSAHMKFETEKALDTKSFFNGIYKWINKDSVLLVAADIELDPSIYYSIGDNIVNPNVYYSQRR